ncbi:MAG TPA: flagellar hook capping FlgD N-terminal domain-containing protein [Candidatus Acidoferrales bacterium]|nr:flagellar hook capping FlgD N-terminal domain-containing protein [Candidatus Acidoferrales bacterium]
MSSTGSVPSISQLEQTPSAASQLPGTASSSSGNSLGPDAFLKLLTTELQNQDPTSPSDPTQSVTQLAQFSALQYQQQLSDSFAAFQSNFGVLQAASLVGKQATVAVSGANGNSTTTGTIQTIAVENGTPYFTMTGSNGQTITDNNGNPLLFSLTQIIGIGAGSTASGGTGTTSGGTGGTGSTPGTGGGT